MKYTFETLYNQEALTIMAKCLRKTVRKKEQAKSYFWMDCSDTCSYPLRCFRC